MAYSTCGYFAHRKRGRGGPFEEGPNRFIGDGLQAKPDAERADLLARPLRDEPGNERPPPPPPPCNGWSGRWTMQPTAGSSCRSRFTGHRCAVLILCQNVIGRSGRLPPRDRGEPGGRAAFHGHGEYPDGRRGGGRRPAGVARANPSAQPGCGGRREERRRQERSHGPAGRRSPAFAKVDLGNVLDASQFVGRRAGGRALAEIVGPIRAKYGARLAADAERA